MKRMTMIGAAGLGLIAAAAQAQEADPVFAPEAVRAHVEFLADDLLEGRDAGSRGYDIAARYVAAEFLGMGLTPAGDQGGWMQSVPLREASLEGAPRLTLTINGETAHYAQGEDVLMGPSLIPADVAVEAPLVFVGYGIDRPDLGIDDYAGLDVTGAIVVTLTGYPKGMASEVGAHLNADKSRMADARGAIGRINVRTRQDAARVPWERYLQYAGEPSLSWVDAEGVPFRRAPGIRNGAYLNRPLAERLFAGAPQSFEEILEIADREGGRPEGFAVDATARIETPSSQRALASANVVAMLPGSDPALAGEYLLMTAHLDGLGVHETGEDGDRIRNGAMDNAAGVATMLEVARALAESADRPRRPILFAALTAEEDGLLGADYLARNPVVDDGEVVAVVNFDMPVLLYELADVIAFGAENSTLGPLVAGAAESTGLALSPDPFPEEGVFTRSDHYRFVQQGVPAVFLATGFANGGEAGYAAFRDNHYHR
ncbi:MAG: M28 family metallopeptidase, partial [Sphingomonadales bacterium]|nr:M28 family metallopeptidase [Sphingomonadales bacterium]